MKIGPLLTLVAFAVAAVFPVIAMLVNQMAHADTGTQTLFTNNTLFKWKSQ